MEVFEADASRNLRIADGTADSSKALPGVTRLLRTIGFFGSDAQVYVIAGETSAPGPMSVNSGPNGPPVVINSSSVISFV